MACVTIRSGSVNARLKLNSSTKFNTGYIHMARLFTIYSGFRDIFKDLKISVKISLNHFKISLNHLKISLNHLQISSIHLKIALTGIIKRYL